MLIGRALGALAVLALRFVTRAAWASGFGLSQSGPEDELRCRAAVRSDEWQTAVVNDPRSAEALLDELERARAAEKELIVLGNAALVVRGRAARPPPVSELP